MLAVVGLLVAGVVVLVAVFSRTGSKAVTPASVVAPVDSVSPVVTESAPPTPVMPRGSSGQAAQASPAEPPPAGRGVRRYAQTWVNVRQSRNVAAPAVRVLNPGEAVLVDSLRGGWYRVLAEGRTVGYVYRSRLDSAPPAAP